MDRAGVMQGFKERGLLGRLCVGERKLEGKTFYLDNVKKRSTTLLLEAISLLGGGVESFLHKDVDFVVTGSQSVLGEEKCLAATKGGAKGTSEGTQEPLRKQESGPRNDKTRPGTPRPMACGSRGKALLEKAICNKERLQRSGVLANARSWGVKILHADDVLLYLKHLTRESFSAKHKRTERTSTKQSFSAVKAAALRSPFLKIEDSSRKYKPLHVQSITFPALCYSGRFSPFESPPPPRFDKQTEQGNGKRAKKAEDSFQDKSQSPLTCNPSPWRPRRKDSSYCECCHQTFTNLEEHLQSDQHRSFVLEASNYSAVDQLVLEMLPGFDPDPPQQTEERASAPLPIHADCELEPLTDTEMEHAVQVLLKEDSPFSGRVSNPTQSRLSSSPDRPSLEVHFTIPNPATPSSDTQSFNPETNHESPDVQPRSSSPAMPVLTVEPLSWQPETVPPCPLSDPYSLPPVLSPQVSYSFSVTELQSSYPEPPILSPQKYTGEEALEGPSSETNPAECGLTAPLSTLLQMFGTAAEEERGPDPLKDAPQSSHSSHSKRCRSSSPEHRNSKRRRRRAIFGESSNEQSHNASEPPAEHVSTAAPSCFVDFPALNPSFPAVQNFALTPTQMDSAPLLGGADDQPQRHVSHSASMRIEPALIPDLTAISSASSDSDWDSGLLPPPPPPPPSEQQSRELDKELLHRSCPWMLDAGYESHLHNVLQPATPAATLCGEDADSQPFSRTVVQIVEVQH
ncbi:protein DBF4 homolog B [Kryptolebias marmoratus]|uniref:Protein DBF4 homolog B-like n=1 Tax=Kryptolebias marmoratus TaxID=37003 RepID=A0A3Q3B463_KRYMA|nr:protein DBF4 homolog B [Kryptolebias marmoratus]